ncbi:MAG: hypothetical protein WBV74_11730 [Pseudonocardiaceae bacterium]
MVELAGAAVLVETDVSGAINLGAQRARLAKELATGQKELAGTEAKLGDAKFTIGRPPTWSPTSGAGE